MIDRFRNVLQELPLPEAPVLVAVSGGRDSMCLATLMLRSGVDLRLAHCNFGLRGADSDADEDLVRRWAEENSLVLHVERFDAGAYAAQRGISLEMAARELRYDWFNRLCVAEGYGAVMVAHHADDQAETLILNLLRGTGARGLAGMRPVSALPAADASVPLLRPLLSFTRAEIDAFVQAEGIPFREDASNADTAFKRNRIRKEAFPVFRSINPSFVETLCRDAAHFAEVDAIAEDFYRTHAASVWDGTMLKTAALKALPHWRYLLWRILSEAEVKPAVIKEVAALLAADVPLSGKQFPAGERVLLGTATGLQWVWPEELGGKNTLVVPSVGSFVLDGTAFSVSLEPWMAGMETKQAAGTLIADAAALPFPFTVRHWEMGDWMQPLGLSGRKKLSDLFTDLKFSRADKAAVLVIADDAHVRAVIGHRIDESLKVTASTRRIVRIRLLGRYK